MSRFVQIATSGIPASDGHHGAEFDVVAVDDQGRAWRLLQQQVDGATRVDYWRRLPPLPEAPEEGDRVEKALALIFEYGGIDGAHHKMWVIDQVARLLAGDRYPEWVTQAKAGPDGPESYGWDEGIPP